jgi:hypothetical protein
MLEVVHAPQHRRKHAHPQAFSVRKPMISKKKKGLCTPSGNPYLLLLSLNYRFKTIGNNKLAGKKSALDKKLGRRKYLKKRSWVRVGFGPVNQVRFADFGSSPPRFHGTFQ